MYKSLIIPSQHSLLSVDIFVMMQRLGDTSSSQRFFGVCFASFSNTLRDFDFSISFTPRGILEALIHSLDFFAIPVVNDERSKTEEFVIQFRKVLRFFSIICCCFVRIRENFLSSNLSFSVKNVKTPKLDFSFDRKII